MKLVALASCQGVALLGFLTSTKLFSKTYMNDPDPQMSLFMKKRLYGHFYGWNSTASGLEPLRGGSLLFTIKFTKTAVTHFLSTSEGRTTQIPKSDPKKGVSVLM